MENITVNDIKNNSNYRYHHTGSRRGYESRKGSGHVESYNGRFGKGYVIISPRWDTTQYVDVHYYIEKSAWKKKKDITKYSLDDYFIKYFSCGGSAVASKQPQESPIWQKQKNKRRIYK